MKRAPSQRIVVFAVFAMLLCLMNVGCVTALSGLFDGQVLLRDDVEARDQDGISPGVRVSWDLLADRDRPRQGLVELSAPASRASSPLSSDVDEPSAVTPTRSPATRPRPRVQTRLSAEAEYSVGLGGNDERSVGPGGRYVDYDGTVFNGPQVLQSSYDLHLASFGVRGGVQLFDLVSLEGLGGLSLTALDLELRGASGSASDTGVSMGVHVGARATITPHPVVDLYGQGKLHLLGGLQDSRRTVVLATAEVGGNLHVTSNVSLFGGYRWWSYFEDIHSASDIDDIVLKGPTAGLLLRF